MRTRGDRSRELDFLFEPQIARQSAHVVKEKSGSGRRSNDQVDYDGDGGTRRGFQTAPSTSACHTDAH